MVARTLLLLVKGNQVLLQKALLTKKIWAGFYNGLGGHIERDEDVLTSAKRELLEESGVKCKDLSLRGVITIEVEEQQGILLFVFSGGKISGSLRSSEEGQLEWVDIEKLATLPLVEDIPLLLDLILQKREPFFGHYSYDDAGKLIPRFNFQD